MKRPTILKIITPLVCAIALLAVWQRHFLTRFLFGSPAVVTRFSPAPEGTLEDYYEAGQHATETAAPSQVSFLAVGDIMLSRNVAAEIKKANNPALPLEGTKELLASADFAFGNLESPIGSIVGGHSLVFGAPIENILPLVENNFKVLNLANNHALDQGASRLSFTKQYLETLGIHTTGAGADLEEAWAPAIVSAQGIKLCFIGASYASVNDGGKSTNLLVARIEDTERLKTSIAAAKKICDFTVATLHAGTEYVRQPNAGQTAFARAAIDFGADMVIGAHPHWIQTVEKYQGRYIFYSLGNFIFDQEWSRETKEGLVLKINLSKTGGSKNSPGAAGLEDLQGSRTGAVLESVELIPVIIENYSTPRTAHPDEAAAILQKINSPALLLP